MTLREYLQTQPWGAQRDLCKLLGVSKTWISLIANGHKVPSASLAYQIEQQTDGRVTRKELRPDLFGEIA